MAKLKTGRHTSALKEFRKSERRRAHNRSIKREIRLLAKKIEESIANKKAEEASKLLPECFSAWDKAAKIGLIHKNAAQRKKSRLSSKIVQLSSKAAA